MKKIILLQLILICVVFPLSSLYSQDLKYHGADSVFEVGGVAVFWAILKGADINSSKVYINIVSLDETKLDFSSYSIFASNIFSGEEEIIINQKPMEKNNLLIQEYGSFSQMAKRRILFYHIGDSSDNPQMEIYYIGVPDTAPEFLEEEQINAFFEHSFQLVLKADGE